MFEVGQKVWDVVRGEGKVVEVIKYDCNYPVVVEFDNVGRETYTRDGKESKGHKKPLLYTYPAEITEKLTKPSVNWDHVHERYNYLAQDDDGTCWVYENKPISVNGDWASSRGDYTSTDCLQSLVPGSCFWEDSLVERPVV